MTYPNIADKETRKALAEQVMKWRSDVRGWKGDEAVRLLIKDWIHGFRRALRIIDDMRT